VSDSPSFDLQTSLAALAVTLLVLTGGCDRDGSSDSPTGESSSPEATEQAAESAQPDADGQNTADEKTASADDSEADDDKNALPGRVSPGDVTETKESWRKRLEEVEVAKEDARALGEVPPGAEVTVYFGAWCPDSRREVPRLWRALEEAGGDVPFTVEYIALDRDFEAGDVDISGDDVDFVPTFVVHRDGNKVGRIVESAPDRLERDLHALLTGEKEGVLSGRSDL
jgi:thiol-disulfide isomerase/thioredoxin